MYFLGTARRTRIVRVPECAIGTRIQELLSSNFISQIFIDNNAPFTGHV